MLKRSGFLGAAAALASPAFPTVVAVAAEIPAIIKPPRLRPGDAVGLISPAGPLDKPDDLQRGIDQVK